MTLIDPYLDRGHTLTIDNFYTTRLAKYLLERKTKTVGTIRHNRKQLPTDFLKDSDIPKGSAVFKHHKNSLAIKYRAAKNISYGKPKVVHLLSTKHNAAMKNTSKTDHDGNMIQKPDAIIYYNKNMGGVDKIDQQLDNINIIRKSFKWYHKVFFRLFSVAMLSSHKIYKEKGGKYDFLQFVHDIVLGLVESSPQLAGVARKNDNLVRLTGRHFPFTVTVPGRGKEKKTQSQDVQGLLCKRKKN